MGSDGGGTAGGHGSGDVNVYKCLIFEGKIELFGCKIIENRVMRLLYHISISFLNTILFNFCL